MTPNGEREFLKWAGRTAAALILALLAYLAAEVRGDVRAVQSKISVQDVQVNLLENDLKYIRGDLVDIKATLRHIQKTLAGEQ